jgi:hypothetical protein
MIRTTATAIAALFISASSFAALAPSLSMPSVTPLAHWIVTGNAPDAAPCCQEVGPGFDDPFAMPGN